MNLAQALMHARLNGIALEQAPGSLSLAEGYAVAEQFTGSLGEQVGWKVGATSLPAQQVLGVTEPIYGRVFAGGVWRCSEEIVLAGDGDAEAEPEVLLCLGRDPGSALVIDDVAEVRLGLEINRPSRPDAIVLGAPFIVADNAAHVGLVIGPALHRAVLRHSEKIEVRLLRNGTLVSQGSAAAVLGNPLRAAEWLVRTRAGTDRPVRAGDWIATGAMCRSCGLARGDEVEADFGAHGKVAAHRA